jgi:hypothetical protein
MFPGFLALQGPEDIFSRSLSSFFHETCLTCNSSVYRSGLLVGVVRKILVTDTKFYQTSIIAPLGGGVGSSGSIHHQN